MANRPDTVDMIEASEVTIQRLEFLLGQRDEEIRELLTTEREMLNEKVTVATTMADAGRAIDALKAEIERLKGDRR